MSDITDTLDQYETEETPDAMLCAADEDCGGGYCDQYDDQEFVRTGFRQIRRGR